MPRRFQIIIDPKNAAPMTGLLAQYWQIAKPYDLPSTFDLQRSPRQSSQRQRVPCFIIYG